MNREKSNCSIGSIREKIDFHMMKDIDKPDPHPLSSFEEFEKHIKSFEEDKKIIDKAADLYSTLPALVKSLTNIVPDQGISSALAQILEDNKAKREKRNIHLALYELTKVIYHHHQKLEELNEIYSSSEISRLTYMYFEYSKNTFEENKIKIFRNIWFNGLLAKERSSSEKSIVFDIIQSLSEDEITALHYVFEKTKDAEKREDKHIHIDEVATALNIDSAYAQQLCVRLRAHGLVGESSKGMTIGSGPPRTFMLMEFTDSLISYTLNIPGE